MGVKNFTKVFPLLEKNRVEFQDYKNKTIVIDVMIELYRSMLGISNRQTLTDKKGNPTIHISVILCLILELYKAEVGQIWCFDNCIESNDDKKDELTYRKNQRNKAEKEYLRISESVDDGDDSDIEFLQAKTTNKSKKENKLDSLRKRTFVVETWMIDDIKFILDCFKITWIEAPTSYESEHLAACLTINNIADAVLTTDVDALLFGAKEIIKRDTRRSQKKGTKKYYKYTLKTLLKENKLSQSDLIKVGICLGNDFIKKGMPGIGPKTVLKKYKIVDSYLSNKKKGDGSDIKKQRRIEVMRSFNQFTRKCPMCTFKTNEFDVSIDIESPGMIRLLNWLGKEKNYNIQHRQKIIEKAIKFRKKKQSPVIIKKKIVLKKIKLIPKKIKKIDLI
jgi:hypothetical protein